LSLAISEWAQPYKGGKSDALALTGAGVACCGEGKEKKRKFLKRRKKKKRSDVLQHPLLRGRVKEAERKSIGYVGGDPIRFTKTVLREERGESKKFLEKKKEEKKKNNRISSKIYIFSIRKAWRRRKKKKTVLVNPD